MGHHPEVGCQTMSVVCEIFLYAENVIKFSELGDGGQFSYYFHKNALVQAIFHEYSEHLV